MDFSFIQKVAVYPFGNLSQDKNASLRVQSVFLMELLRQEGLRVIEPGTVRKAAQDLRLPAAGELTPDQLMALGQAIGADGVFQGTVEDYGLERQSSSKTFFLTASFTFSETVTGMTIWRSQVNNSGDSLFRKLFGGGSASLFDVTREAVNDAQKTLF